MEKIAKFIAEKLSYRDFTKGELLKIINELNIEITNDQIEELITKLGELGFSYEEGFHDFSYESAEVEDYEINHEKKLELKAKKRDYYDSLGIRGSGMYSNEELLKAISLDIIKRLDKKGVMADSETVYKIVQRSFNNNPAFYELARSINHIDKQKLQNTLCDYYLAHQSYLISLVNVKSTDARLVDLAAALQTKESSEKAKNEFSNKYPETSIIENQVDVQDANNTFATAALNMAMEELGPNATPEAIRTRSLEILEEEKANQSKKGSI